MGKRIIIIDGNSLINRAYYAMQRPMITKEGVYTQGIYGFINMLTKIQNDYQPDYLTVAWDRKAPTFRHEAYLYVYLLKTENAAGAGHGDPADEGYPAGHAYRKSGA